MRYRDEYEWCVMRKRGLEISGFADYLKGRGDVPSTVNSYSSLVSGVLKNASPLSREGIESYYASQKEVNQAPLRCAWEAYRRYRLEADTAPSGSDTSECVPPMPSSDPEAPSAVLEALLAICTGDQDGRIPDVGIPTMTRLKWDITINKSLSTMFKNCTLFSFSRGDKEIVVPILTKPLKLITDWAYPSRGIFIGDTLFIDNRKLDPEAFVFPRSPDSKKGISVPQLSRMIEAARKLQAIKEKSNDKC